MFEATMEVTGVFEANIVAEDDFALDLSIYMECTAEGVAPQLYGPPERCYPGHGPEFEPGGFILSREGKTILKDDWKALEALLGEDAVTSLIEEAEEQAINSGEY